MTKRTLANQKWINEFVANKTTMESKSNLTKCFSTLDHSHPTWLENELQAAPKLGKQKTYIKQEWLLVITDYCDDVTSNILILIYHISDIKKKHASACFINCSSILLTYLAALLLHQLELCVDFSILQVSTI